MPATASATKLVERKGHQKLAHFSSFGSVASPISRRSANFLLHVASNIQISQMGTSRPVHMDVQTPSCAPPKTVKSNEKISSHVNNSLKLSGQGMGISVTIPKFWKKLMAMVAISNSPPVPAPDMSLVSAPWLTASTSPRPLPAIFSATRSPCFSTWASIFAPKCVALSSFSILGRSPPESSTRGLRLGVDSAMVKAIPRLMNQKA